MLVSFQLTMPNVGSWNGQWSGAGRQYFVIKNAFAKKRTFNGLETGRVKELLGDKERVGFYYNFGDGWGASVSMEIVDAKEANRRRKASSGFCGYEWMIDSIMKHGKIIVEKKEVLV